MKKTIMLVLCILILIVGCDKQKESNERKENRVSISLEEIYTVMCDGHKYVIFDGINKGGIVHAESCECKKTTNDKKNASQ